MLLYRVSHLSASICSTEYFEYGNTLSFYSVTKYGINISTKRNESIYLSKILVFIGNLFSERKTIDRKLQEKLVQNSVAEKEARYC